MITMLEKLASIASSHRSLTLCFGILLLCVALRRRIVSEIDWQNGRLQIEAQIGTTETYSSDAA